MLQSARNKNSGSMSRTVEQKLKQGGCGGRKGAAHNEFNECKVFTYVFYNIFNRFNPNVLVTIALGLSAICIIAIPLSHIFVIMLFLAGVFGGCFGATDTFTTVQLIRMYGKQVSQ